ncbi:hypothetical protein DFH11DRAFT_516502 [Phellopilus nigrolimitatus]|nr:hypothetical protein DFH11DRAFT_516502 [Phellopilus nigrolimitatus]
MKFALTSLLLACLSPIAHAYDTYGLGTSWSIGTGSNSSISKVTTTLNAGTPPTSQPGELVLWPGLSNGTGDLLMASVESWDNQTWCDGTASQWCIRTFVFSDQRSIDGTYAALNSGEPVTFIFERNADASGWSETAVVGGNVVAQVISASGPMTLFGVTTECNDDCAMTVSPQTYTNTTIVLDSADPAWGETAVVGSAIYGGGTFGTILQTVVNGLTSSQDGKVWSVAEIMIPRAN